MKASAILTLPLFAVSLCLPHTINFEEKRDSACNKPVSPPFVDNKYYADAYANVGSASKLKSSLNKILTSSFIAYSYSCVWDILKNSDQDPANSDNVILLYNAVSYPKYLKDNGTETEAWNREHVWPKSHGFPNESQDPYTDAHHLRPADKRVNTARNDKDFKDGGSNLCVNPYGATSGCKTYAKYTDSSFEPPAFHKGDVARMIFYMEVRYQSNPTLKIVNGVTYRTSSPQLGWLCNLYNWHKSDPVDSFERRRNNIVYEWQLNRNPFIDHPEWLDIIFGSTACLQEDL